MIHLQPQFVEVTHDHNKEQVDGVTVTPAGVSRGTPGDSSQGSPGVHLETRGGGVSRGRQFFFVFFKLTPGDPSQGSPGVHLETRVGGLQG